MDISILSRSPQFQNLSETVIETFRSMPGIADAHFDAFPADEVERRLERLREAARNGETPDDQEVEALRRLLGLNHSDLKGLARRLHEFGNGLAKELPEIMTMQDHEREAAARQALADIDPATRFVADVAGVTQQIARRAFLIDPGETGAPPLDEETECKLACDAIAAVGLAAAVTAAVTSAIGCVTGFAVWVLSVICLFATINTYIVAGRAVLNEREKCYKKCEEG